MVFTMYDAPANGAFAGFAAAGAFAFFYAKAILPVVAKQIREFLC
jgi:hypothetical protein